VTENGLDLMGRNHDWGRLVQKVTLIQGMKPVLERYITEFQMKREGL
jgi:hypothetical protein